MNKIEKIMAEKVKAVKARAKHLLQHPDDLFKPQRRVIARKMRKVVTGDEKKRIRDHLHEKKEEPTNTKLFDKVSFTLGVLNIPVCQFFMLNRPDLFWLWFSFIIPTLLIARYIYYSKIKMQYFLYDFCYFTNILSVLVMHTYDTLPSLFRIVFIFCNGPLGWAVVVWRNSLVYHDFDRMTSIYIHILPAMLSFCVRWHGLSEENAVGLKTQDFFNASFVYLFWQFLYYCKTEVMDKPFLDKNPEVVTSLRWLATDKKNGMARMVLRLCRRLRIFGPTEDYNPSEFKTLLVFMGAQFVYTVVTMLPATFIYSSKKIQLAFITFIFTCVVYNGASYYIEVFSKRYQLKFAKKEDMQKVVQAAAEIAYEATQSASSPRKLSSRSLGGSSRSLGGSSKSLIASKFNKSLGKGSSSSIVGSSIIESEVGRDDPVTNETKVKTHRVGLSLEDDVDSEFTPEMNSPLRTPVHQAEESNISIDEGNEHLQNCNLDGDDDVERERTQSEDVRDIIEAATTLFVDEWHLANESHVDHQDEHDDYSLEDCSINSEERESSEKIDIKDKYD